MTLALGALALATAPQILAADRVHRIRERREGCG